MFEPENTQRLSRRSFLASVAAHTAGVMLLGMISFPEVRPTFRERPMLLTMPVIELPALMARRKTIHALAKAKPSRKFVAPQSVSARMRTQAPVPVDPSPMTLDPGPLEILKVPAVAPPTLSAPPRQIDFGTAEALALNSPRKSPSETSAFGSAAVSGGERRKGPITHSSGFAEAAEAQRSKASVAATAGFGSAVVAEPVRSSSRMPSASALSTPVEILDKPRPIYTEEARRAAIEGEVLLEVLFGASGQVRVLRILRGLGYGLDQQAADAAGRIRFRPATREGAAFDSSAVVHIIFQLAY